jgi:hypothetical protein
MAAMVTTHPVILYDGTPATDAESVVWSRSPPPVAMKRNDKKQSSRNVMQVIRIHAY